MQASAACALADGAILANFCCEYRYCNSGVSLRLPLPQCILPILTETFARPVFNEDNHRSLCQKLTFSLAVKEYKVLWGFYLDLKGVDRMCTVLGLSLDDAGPTALLEHCTPARFGGVRSHAAQSFYVVQKVAGAAGGRAWLRKRTGDTTVRYRYGRLSPECQTENTRHLVAFRLEPLTQHAQGPRPRRPALAQLLACKTKTTSVLNIRASTACTLWPTGPAMMPKCHDPGILRILAARDTRHVELLVGGVEVALDHRIGIVRIQSRRDDAAPATPSRVSSEWLPQFAAIKMSGSRSRTETRHGVCSR